MTAKPPLRRAARGHLPRECKLAREETTNDPLLPHELVLVGEDSPRERAGGGPSRTDVFTAQKRSAVMARVKGRDTGPELLVRRLLHGAGYRFRLHAPELPGRPDMAFTRRRAAVFIHGCFWHGHDCPRGSRQPKANADYWSAKIARNRARDGEVEARLQALGWRTLTIWECELKPADALLARLRSELGPPRAQAAAVSGASEASAPAASSRAA